MVLQADEIADLQKCLHNFMSSLYLIFAVYQKACNCIKQMAKTLGGRQAKAGMVINLINLLGISIVSTSPFVITVENTGFRVWASN